MIYNDPDDAGLIGAAHLLPPWMLKGHDTMLAVDIGGTNIRVGTVELNIGKSQDLVKSKVANSEIWCHAETETDRSGAVSRLAKMLEDQVRWNSKRSWRWRQLLALAVQGSFARMALLIAAARISLAIGKAVAFTFLKASRKR